MISMPLAHYLAKLSRTLIRSSKRRLDHLPRRMSRPACPLLVPAWHHTAYPAWQAIRRIIHRADPICPQRREALYKHIHIFNPMKPPLSRDLLVQLMQHLTFIAQFHPPHRPIIFRPAMRTPQVFKPRLARLAQFAGLVIDREGERATVGEIQPRFLQPIRIISCVASRAPLRLSMTTTLKSTRDKIALLIQLVDALPPSKIHAQIDSRGLQVHLILEERVHKLLHLDNGIQHPLRRPEKFTREAHRPDAIPRAR